MTNSGTLEPVDAVVEPVVVVAKVVAVGASAAATLPLLGQGCKPQSRGSIDFPNSTLDVQYHFQELEVLAHDLFVPGEESLHRWGVPQVHEEGKPARVNWSHHVS